MSRNKVLKITADTNEFIRSILIGAKEKVLSIYENHTAAYSLLE